MWGYQPHFRSRIQTLANDVLKELGIEVDAKALLVGVRRPGIDNPNRVCVEPEDGEWSLALFDGISESIEDIYMKDERQGLFYGDERSMLEKPEMMRRDAVTDAVREALRPFDQRNSVRSFCGTAKPVEGFHVVPVIQVPQAVFEKFPRLAKKPVKRPFAYNGYRSFVDAALGAVLEEASSALQGPEPGRALLTGMRRADEVVRIAAETFMQTPGRAINEQYTFTDLFSRLNLISSLLYEGAQGVGRLLLVNAENPHVEFLIRFRTPVPFSQARWVRKTLQLAGQDAAVIADSEKIYGLGRLLPSHDASAQDVFTVDFLDHHVWEVRCGELALLRSHYRVPTLPNEIVDKDSFKGNLERLFPTSDGATREQIWNLFCVAVRQGVGSMLVVSEDAANESRRLASQGTAIEPVKLTVELLRQVTAIDGTILLDPLANCHAIGVILDGSANEECTPSRGSRFNSAVRYVRSAEARRLAIVVSEDRTVDIFPRLRPRLSRAVLEAQIAAFVASNIESHHTSLNWLRSNGFYLDSEQCAQINAKIEWLDAQPLEVGQIRWVQRPFEVHPEFESNYLLP